jgi:hypothetical protein
LLPTYHSPRTLHTLATKPQSRLFRTGLRLAALLVSSYIRQLSISFIL